MESNSNSTHDSIITILWSVPRSVSTAFERAIVELSTILNTDNNVCNAMDVYHEPFSQPYYYNEKDQQSTRFSPIDNTPSFEEVVNDIKNSAQNCQYVFSKDMAYYTKNRMSKLVIPEATHTFIIRNPSKTIPSLYKASYNSKGHDTVYHQNMDFDPSECGFVEMLAVFNYVKDELKQSPLVIDADDLLLNPSGYMKEYCSRTGLPYRDRMLTWQAGVVPKGWEQWEGWHDDAINSSGLKKRERKKPTEGDDIIPPRYENELKVKEVRSAIAESMHAYETMSKHKLVIEA